MMRIEILTLFPGYFESPLAESLLGKGIAAGLLRVSVTDLRIFSADKHRKVDDEPYGGGPGMVMMAPVAAAAVEARRAETSAWAAVNFVVMLSGIYYPISVLPGWVQVISAGWHAIPIFEQLTASSAARAQLRQRSVQARQVLSRSP